MRKWIITGLLLATAIVGAVVFTQHVYSFLAVPTIRVDANILVVEGWIFDYGFDAGVAEFKRGHYSYVATSGVPFPSGDDSVGFASAADWAAAQLEARGLQRSRILTCPAPPVVWNRTSSSARAVREKLRREGIPIQGINVVTIGPHARQTWLAYRRIMGAGTPVGIITVPKQGLDTAHWWRSAHGIKMVTKDFAGWLREALFGLRS